MARDTQSIVKMSRREGYALHPKAHKALVKRTALPGQKQTRGRGPNKPSQYSLQLREKQKVKRLYGLLERQFSNLMKQATRSHGQSSTFRQSAWKLATASSFVLPAPNQLISSSSMTSAQRPALFPAG